MIVSMRKTSQFSVLAVFVFLLCFGETRAEPVAGRGMLDLRAYDFAREGPLSLRGELEFFWRLLLLPGEPAPGSAQFARIPLAWNAAIPSGETGGGLSGSEGFATYRLKILLPPAAPALALQISPQFCALAIFANGQPVGSAGAVGTTAAETAVAARSIRLNLPAATELDLIFHVANFHNSSGGIEREILLGPPGDLEALQRKQLAGILFLVGSFVIIGLYHLSLFHLRPGEPSTLFFGLVCLVWSLRLLVLGDRPLTEVWPTLDFETALKLVYLTFTFGLPLFCLYVRALFPDQFSRLVLRILVTPGLLFSLVVVALPVRLFSHLQIPFEIGTVVTEVYVLYVILRARSQGSPGARVFLFGLVVFAAAILNDILNNHGWLASPDLAPVGLFVFLFSQAYLLSRRSADAFRRTAELSANLEHLADERNRDLQAALADLRAKDALLQQELDIASEIQAGNQPEMPARFGEFYVNGYSRSRGKVGGDFFDLLEMSYSRMGVLIADGSGHGVPAALVANMARMSFREEARRRVSPRSILEHVNTTMSRVLGTQEYITAFLIVVSPDGKLLFSNAANRNPAILRRGGEIDFLRADGLLLGAFETRPSSYEEGRERMEKGDRVLLFTDGLIDLFMDDDPDAWEENFRTFLSGRTQFSTDELRTALIEHLATVEVQKALSDDITFLILERTI